VPSAVRIGISSIGIVAVVIVGVYRAFNYSGSSGGYEEGR